MVKHLTGSLSPHVNDRPSRHAPSAASRRLQACDDTTTTPSPRLYAHILVTCPPGHLLTRTTVAIGTTTVGTTTVGTTTVGTTTVGTTTVGTTSMVGTAAKTVATGPAAVTASGVPNGVRPGCVGGVTAVGVAIRDEGGVRTGMDGVASGEATGRRLSPGSLIVGVAVGVSRAAAVGVVLAFGVPVALAVAVAACGVLVGLNRGVMGGVCVLRGIVVARGGRAVGGKVDAVAVGDAGSP